MSDIEHGTYKGYVRCRWLPEGACQDCKIARNEYMADWRKKNPKAYQRTGEVLKRRNKALRILGNRHQKELNNIIRDLRNQENVESSA